ncbi:MAG: hypothetical protein ISS70_22520 [Phycisphaerae bacterium]|nr:hypothetical protein [Phycisphaerae bacterium]
MNVNKIRDLRAQPDPHGGQIDLSWTNPVFEHFAGVKILRRESAFPNRNEISTENGVFNHKIIEPQSPIKPGELSRFSDKGLKPETIYYYAVAAYDAAPTPEYYTEYASALATTAYQTGAYLYQNLPTIYRSMDHEKRQLRQLVDMFGLQFDLLRSFTSASRHFSDIDHIDGQLLGLLAQWIGWQSGPVPPDLIARLRNEIKRAPHFYRTTGVPANLYATLNRLSTWDAQIKEFVHSIFRSNDPERLTVWEAIRRADGWQVSDEPVTLDLAYEGKPAAVQTQDERQLLFYHARQSPSPPRIPGKNPVVRDITNDNWHIWYKVKDGDRWSGARRLTFLGEMNKYPAAFQKSDGNIWLFWNTHKKIGGASVPQIQLELLSAGRPARPARVQGTQSEPFTFSDGDTFRIIVGGSVPREITFRREHFHIDQPAIQAEAAEVVRLLNSEIPGLEVTQTENHRIVFTSLTKGANSQIVIPNSPVAAQLGLAFITGNNTAAAQFTGSRNGPFALSDGDTISIKVDADIHRLVTFQNADFQNIAQASTAEVVGAINQVLPGIATSVGGHIRLTSPTVGAASVINVDVDASTAAPKLGFSADVGDEAVAAELTGSQDGPFALSDGDTISIQVDSDPPQTITFRTGDFGNAQPIAAQVAAVINRVLPNIASDAGGHVRLTSPTAGEGAFVGVEVNASTAAPELGFGAPLPAANPIVADEEPAALEDNNKNVWLFWSSRRTGRWKIWYNHFNGTSWANAQRLTSGLESDRQPSVVHDSSVLTERIWLFWSRKKANGRWNVLHRRIDNPALPNAPANWGAVSELLPALTDYDNREPAAILNSDGSVELYFSSNQADGWNIWSTVIPPDPQNPAEEIDLGQANHQRQFTHRAPMALGGGNQPVTLWFRSNRSQVYPSDVYQGIETKDARYAGSTTVDTRNRAKMILRRDIEDIQHYTYDTRKTEAGWYARDTVGVFTISDTFDPEATSRHLDMLKDGTKRFLPIQLRPVFINHPRADFRWARTWDGGPPSAVLPDLSVSPPEIFFGLYHSEFTEGE